MDVVFVTLDLFIFLCVMTIFGFVFTGYTFVDELFWLPQYAKTLRKCKFPNNNFDALFHVHDDSGHEHLEGGKTVAQGLIQIGKDSDPSFIFLPRIAETGNAIMNIREQLDELKAYKIPDVDDSGQPLSPDMKQNLIQAVAETVKSLSDQLSSEIEVHDKLPANQNFVLYREFMDGVNKPVYHIYVGKTIAVTTRVLALLGLPQVKEAEEEKSFEASIFGHWKKRLPILALNKSDVELMFGVMVDARIIKLMVSKLYTPSHIKAVVEKSADRERARLKKGHMSWIIPLIFVMVAVLALVLVAKYMKWF